MCGVNYGWVIFFDCDVARRVALLFGNEAGEVCIIV